MGMIAGHNLCKTYRARDGRIVIALDDVDITVEEHEFYVLLGPSGSGKTTTLRSIAGLERPDSGEISIDGRTVFSASQNVRVAPEERPISMVFQSYALWPHMNVFDNIAFPLRHGIRRVQRNQVAHRVERALSLLQMTDQAQRQISTLSGGQQQRVALARAIALEPAVLLMDEPLSNLDARLRGQLRTELKALTRSIGITTLYVTHDQTEAMVMGDRIAVMKDGAILQEGSGIELYQKPQHLFVAKFLGEMNFLKGRLESTSGGNARVVTSAGPLIVTRSHDAPEHGPVTIGFRLEDAYIAAGPGDNIIRGTITDRHYLGDVFVYEVRSGDQLVHLRRPNNEQFEIGTEVFLGLPPSCVVVFGGTA